MECQEGLLVGDRIVEGANIEETYVIGAILRGWIVLKVIKAWFVSFRKAEMSLLAVYFYDQTQKPSDQYRVVRIKNSFV